MLRAKTAFRRKMWWLVCPALNDESMTEEHLLAIASAWVTLSSLLATDLSAIEHQIKELVPEIASRLPMYALYHGVVVAGLVHARVNTGHSRVYLEEATAPCAVWASQGNIKDAVLAHARLQDTLSSFHKISVKSTALSVVCCVPLSDSHSRPRIAADFQDDFTRWMKSQKRHTFSSIIMGVRSWISRDRVMKRLETLRSFAAGERSAPLDVYVHRTRRLVMHDISLAAAGGEEMLAMEAEARRHMWGHWLAWWDGDSSRDLFEAKQAAKLFEICRFAPSQAKAMAAVVHAHISLGDLETADRSLDELIALDVGPDSGPVRMAHLLEHCGFGLATIALLRNDTKRLRTIVSDYIRIRTNHGWRSFWPNVVCRLFFLAAEGLCNIADVELISAEMMAERTFRLMDDSTSDELLTFVTPTFFHAITELILRLNQARAVETKTLQRYARQTAKLLLKWRTLQPGLAGAHAAVLQSRLERTKLVKPSLGTKFKWLTALALAQQSLVGKRVVDEALIGQEVGLLRGEDEVVQKANEALAQIGFVWFSRHSAAYMHEPPKGKLADPPAEDNNLQSLQVRAGPSVKRFIEAGQRRSLEK